jgi:hypothetical protein
VGEHFGAKGISHSLNILPFWTIPTVYFRTFFARQGSSMPTWMNAGIANYHGITFGLRRAFSNGFSFDFNYTLSHSIDNASAAEGASGQDGAVIQNVFNSSQFRGSSDLDIRQLTTLDVVYELPFGKGKPLLGRAPAWLNEIVGGWQISSIMRFSSDLPQHHSRQL